MADISLAEQIDLCYTYLTNFLNNKE